MNAPTGRAAPVAMEIEAGPATDLAARALVVDDHPLNRKLVAAMLSHLGVEVAYAANGQEACLAFMSETFDLVVMDIQMPVMDGLTATRMIRSVEAERSLPRTPVLVLTANSQPEDVAASLDAGADEHLAKPIRLASLVEALRRT